MTWQYNLGVEDYHGAPTRWIGGEVFEPTATAAVLRVLSIHPHDNIVAVEVEVIE